MTHLNFEQEQALIARGRGLQGQAIRTFASTLYHLPDMVMEALGQREASSNDAHKGQHAA